MSEIARIHSTFEKARLIDPLVNALDGFSVYFSGIIHTVEIAPDGMCINPEYLDTITDETMVIIWRHEARHIVKRHHERGKEAIMALKQNDVFCREAYPELFHSNGIGKWTLLQLFWNVAADLDANQDLADLLDPRSSIVAGQGDYENIVEGLVEQPVEAETFFAILIHVPKWRDVTRNLMKRKGYGYVDRDE